MIINRPALHQLILVGGIAATALAVQENEDDLAPLLRPPRARRVSASVSSQPPFREKHQGLRSLQSCGAAIIDDDFEASTGLGKDGDWYANYYWYYWSNPNGAPHSHTSIDSHTPGDTYALFYSRTSGWNGPTHSVDASCLDSDTVYRFSAKVRLTVPGGGVSNCQSQQTNCLYATMYMEDVNPAAPTDPSQNLDNYDWIGGLFQPVTDGVWYDWTFTFQLVPGAVDSSALGGGGILTRTVYIEGPEGGVDIALDDVSIVAEVEETDAPTGSPTSTPTSTPTMSPTDKPTYSPTYMPTDAPTEMPTGAPSENPTSAPTNSPTHVPSASPTSAPTNAPTKNPSFAPTNEPTNVPTKAPTANPTSTPTDVPTKSPSSAPTVAPVTTDPTDAPTQPPTCPSEAISIIEDDFEASTGLGKDGDWYANYYFNYGSNPNGAPHSHTSIDSHTPGDTYALFYSRTSGWNGLTHFVDVSCLDSDTVYRFSAKVRLTVPGGGVSNCQSQQTNCLYATMYMEDVNPAAPTDPSQNLDNYDWIGGLFQPVTDGVWYDWTFTFQLVPGAVDSSALGGGGILTRTVYIEGPEGGVDIALDDVSIVAEVEETDAPTGSPTSTPTSTPTMSPTDMPTEHPTNVPTTAPTFGPTAGPTSMPSDTPTMSPTFTLTEAPTSNPTSAPVSVPTLSCPDPLTFDNFDSSYGLSYPDGWHANYYYSYSSNPNGAPHEYRNDNSHTPSNTYALFTSRTSEWQGIQLRLDQDCIIPGREYTLTAKVRLTRPDGNLTKCESSNSNCLYLTYYKEDLDPNGGSNLKDWDWLGGSQQSTTGVWYDFATTFTFDDSVSDSSVLGGAGIVRRDIYFEGPEGGVDIAIDDLRFGLVPVDPTPAPTSSATGAPTPEGYVPPIPEGPYISKEESSAVVVIPDPPVPSMLEGTARIGCPHHDSGLLSWHDPATWGGSVPANGDVTLPANSRVLVSQSIDNSLGVVTVPANTELIFGETANGITFDVAGMDVQGTVTAGSETCRIEESLTVTLHGTRPTDLDDDGKSPLATTTYKGISVSGGRLDLHGRRYHRTWTRLSKTLEPGNSVVLLQHSVNWRAGQEIVLVTTAMKDSRDWHQNEVLTIKNVEENATAIPVGVGAVIYLETPVQHKHLANRGYQAEVGLLTRDIVIQGSAADSEPSQTDDGTFTDRGVYGNSGAPDPSKDIDGFGGHIMVHSGGLGYVEGVELYRMGQTNVLGRYPMHFHVLGNDCTGCYFKDSSIHHSFYRCISIHGTHNTTVSENVGYDVTGYCFYLEDGVEEDNTISFNLATHIHFLGQAPHGDGQTTALNYQNKDMILPADVTASGYYITNVHNDIIGNAASGGWAGFAFPILYEPLGPHRTVNMRPSSRTSKTIDGNTAHSSGWWWGHSGAFYFGGTLYYDSNDMLVYNAGRDTSKWRSPCNVDLCETGNCNDYCQAWDQAWIQLTNSKVFLAAGVGLNSWTGRMEIIGYEAHDSGLSMEALASGFYIDNMLAVCRSGEDLIMPPGGVATYLSGNGFFWYDTGQEHIITNSTFRNCGYRQSSTNNYDQYDSSPTRGCYTDPGHGCGSRSTVFGFLTHSDEHNPEVMQATKEIKFEDCGRRFYLRDFRDYMDPPPASTVSGRTQNWYDADGSASGLNVPTLIGSGLADSGLWWDVEDDATFDSHGPLWFIKQQNGPARNLGHIKLQWDSNLHSQVGSTVCGNGALIDCNPEGYIKHFGPRFASDIGLPVTANADIAGLTGGYGWLLELNNGAPKNLDINTVEVDPTSPLVFSIQYPPGTSFAITANAAYCTDDLYYSCSETFQQVASRAEVRNSLGNVYHVDSNGFLTIRIVMTAQTFTGNPDWILPDYNTIGKWGNGLALGRFSRGGLTLPSRAYGPWLNILADCSSSDGIYCSNTPVAVTPSVCSVGYVQVSYDSCCLPPEFAVCNDAAQAA